MQLVTVEVCARRILPAATTVTCESVIANPIANNKRVALPQRMTDFLSASIIAPSDGRGNVLTRPFRLSGEDIIAHRRGIALHFPQTVLDDVADRHDAD